MRIKLPLTTKRVQQNTPKQFNQKIAAQTQQNIKKYQDLTSQDVTNRIQELEAEWDTERVLETNFATLILLTTALGFKFNRNWFALGGLAALFLLQHALQGWCPPLAVIRRLGIRTADEINHELNALNKMLVYDEK